MNCKYLKQKLNHKLECKLNNKMITLNDCKNCKYKEYKCTINPKNCANQQNKTTKNTMIDKKIKSKSNKLAKLEKNRFSLFSDNKDECMFCDNTTDLTWHEIFRGKNRANSMKYGLCLRMCWKCHERWQEDKSFNDYWHKLGQQRFMQYYHKTKEEFREIFKRNFL